VVRFIVARKGLGSTKSAIREKNEFCRQLIAGTSFKYGHCGNVVDLLFHLFSLKQPNKFVESRSVNEWMCSDPKCRAFGKLVQQYSIFFVIVIR
jgi:hypothetical protein